MLPPTVAIVGVSNSGKTTVASSLVEILAGAGYRVAAIKHCPHGHDLDRDGSDTHRLYEAGAVIVVACSPNRLTATNRLTGEAPLESIVGMLAGQVNLVVAEGFKNSSVPKVLVTTGTAPEPLPDNIISVITDEPGKWEQPTYSSREVHMLASQIERQFLDGRSGSRPVSLFVDGEAIPLKAFPAQALAAMVKGFVSSLDGIPEGPTLIQLSIDDQAQGIRAVSDNQAPEGKERRSR